MQGATFGEAPTRESVSIARLETATYRFINVTLITRLPEGAPYEANSSKHIECLTGLDVNPKVRPRCALYCIAQHVFNASPV